VATLNHLGQTGCDVHHRPGDFTHSLHLRVKSFTKKAADFSAARLHGDAPSAYSAARLRST